MFLNKFRFDHKTAQEYELRSHRSWIQRNFERVYFGRSADTSSKWLREWFPDEDSFDYFQRQTAGKTCLEIGSGPSGNLIYFWWAARRIIIDPLVVEYRDISLKFYGKTWFDGIELIPINAETLQTSLIGNVNGAIICRNTLDHCANPMQVLENIAAYTAPGCYLLLWTDLHHIGGHDEGHRDITSNPAAFTRKLLDLGFEIEYITPQKLGRNTIHYGCRARKNWEKP
jgi:SAM-dependent methyltransferase